MEMLQITIKQRLVFSTTAFTALLPTAEAILLWSSRPCRMATPATAVSELTPKFKLHCNRRSVSLSASSSRSDFYYRRTFEVFLFWGALPDERAGR
jgi:hypothetical protein